MRAYWILPNRDQSDAILASDGETVRNGFPAGIKISSFFPYRRRPVSMLRDEWFTWDSCSFSNRMNARDSTCRMPVYLKKIRHMQEF
jgi:hypothetical protein